MALQLILKCTSGKAKNVFKERERHKNSMTIHPVSWVTIIFPQLYSLHISRRMPRTSREESFWEINDGSCELPNISRDRVTSISVGSHLWPSKVFRFHEFTHVSTHFSSAHLICFFACFPSWIISPLRWDRNFFFVHSTALSKSSNLSPSHDCFFLRGLSSICFMNWRNSHESL